MSNIRDRLRLIREGTIEIITENNELNEYLYMSESVTDDITFAVQNYTDYLNESDSVSSGIIGKLKRIFEYIKKKILQFASMIKTKAVAMYKRMKEISDNGKEKVKKAITGKSSFHIHSKLESKPSVKAYIQKLLVSIQSATDKLINDQEIPEWLDEKTLLNNGSLKLAMFKKSFGIEFSPTELTELIFGKVEKKAVKTLEDSYIFNMSDYLKECTMEVTLLLEKNMCASLDSAKNSFESNIRKNTKKGDAEEVRFLNRLLAWVSNVYNVGIQASALFINSINEVKSQLETAIKSLES